MKFSLLFLKSDLINYYIHQEKEVGLLSVWFENSNKGLLVSILFNSWNIFHFSTLYEKKLVTFKEISHFSLSSTPIENSIIFLWLNLIIWTGWFGHSSKD